MRMCLYLMLSNPNLCAKKIISHLSTRILFLFYSFANIIRKKIKFLFHYLRVRKKKKYYTSLYFQCCFFQFLNSQIFKLVKVKNKKKMRGLKIGSSCFAHFSRKIYKKFLLFLTKFLLRPSRNA
jgi:hypothetical protein